MKGIYVTLAWVCGLIMLVGCASVPRAPKAATGKPVEIVVYCFRGNPADMNEKQYKLRQEVGQWLEKDLVNQLNRAGYKASLTATRDGFQPQADRYLLAVSIVSYNPGSSAARAFVGYGAGAAALNTECELQGPDAPPVAAWKDGAGTSQHWSKLPRKLNRNAVGKVTAALAAK